VSPWILAPTVLLLVLDMLASAVRKVTESPASTELRGRLAVPPRTWALIAIAEGPAAAGLLAGLHARALGVLAASGCSC
jgi:hypothetical protein